MIQVVFINEMKENNTLTKSNSKNNKILIAIRVDYNNIKVITSKNKHTIKKSLKI